MLFYTQLQQMDGKWNDKWAIMVRKWMKDMSISVGKMENSRAQQQLVNSVQLSVVGGKMRLLHMHPCIIHARHALAN